MIKRLTKSKKSKKGAILVIVVLILALAMIFIASAMMLTQATRRRLYSNAMQSQARLTVTAASEVFLEALNMQEITDVQLDAMIDKSATTGKIRMVVDNVPGMSKNDDTNVTWLEIHSDPKDKDYVYCDFTTVIGDSTENVQVILHAEESNPSYGSQFKNQVELAGSVGCAQMRFTDTVGMWDSTKIKTGRPTDNNIVLRKGYAGVTSGSQYISDVVFGQNASSCLVGGGENFYGRLIFLKGSKLNSQSNANIYGEIYCIGDDDSAGFTINPDQPGVWDTIQKTSTDIVFAGRKVENDPGLSKCTEKIDNALNNGKHKVYFLDKNGNTLGSNHSNATGIAGSNTFTVTNAWSTSDDETIKAHQNTISSNVTRYQGWDYSGSFPTAASVFKTLCPDGKKPKGDGTKTLPYDTYSPSGTFFEKGKAIPADQEYIQNPVTTTYPEYKDEQPLEKNYLYLDDETTSRKLDPGYYYITAHSPKTSTTYIGDDTQGANPVVLAINGKEAGSYRFYFEGGRQFVLRGIIFAIYNADESKPVIFVLEKDAKVQLSHANDDVGSAKLLCSAGFLSVPNRPGCTSDTAVIDYVTTHSWSDESTTVSNNLYKDPSGTVPSGSYSKYYDNLVRPCMFIYGVGGNVIALGKAVTIEAYIGLYGGSCLGPINCGGEHQQIYGRLECDSIHTYHNTIPFKDDAQNQPVGEFAMPYCPQPLTNSSKHKQRIAISKYKVVDIVYYYGSGAHPSPTPAAGS